MSDKEIMIFMQEYNKHLEERYAEAIKNWGNCPFVEESHENADDLLCELLQQLGFNKVVDEYKKLVRFFG